MLSCWKSLSTDRQTDRHTNTRGSLQYHHYYLPKSENNSSRRCCLVQLAVEFPHTQSPGSSNWQPNLLFISTRCRSSPWMCARPPAVRTLHPLWLHCQTSRELNTEVRWQMQTKMRVFIRRKSTACCSASAKPRSWLMILDKKRQRHTPTPSQVELRWSRWTVLCSLESQRTHTYIQVSLICHENVCCWMLSL